MTTLIAALAASSADAAGAVRANIDLIALAGLGGLVVALTVIARLRARGPRRFGWSQPHQAAAADEASRETTAAASADDDTLEPTPAVRPALNTPYAEHPTLAHVAELLADGRADAARQIARAALAAALSDDAPHERALAELALADAAQAERDAGAAAVHAVAAERAAEAASDPRLAAHGRARRGRALTLTTRHAEGDALMADAADALRADGRVEDAAEIARWRAATAAAASCSEPAEAG